MEVRFSVWRRARIGSIYFQLESEYEETHHNRIARGVFHAHTKAHTSWHCYNPGNIWQLIFQLEYWNDVIKGSNTFEAYQKRFIHDSNVITNQTNERKTFLSQSLVCVWALDASNVCSELFVIVFIRCAV